MQLTFNYTYVFVPNKFWAKWRFFMKLGTNAMTLELNKPPNFSIPRHKQHIHGARAKFWDEGDISDT
jgi:hypothetical protein